ncbi:ribonuclease H-like domain-containing protein, partial [Tanacetum coccineum]
MPYQWKGLLNYESFISSPLTIRTCLRMLLQADVLLFMGARITLDVLDFIGKCMSRNICDKKNKVLFTDTECLVLSPEFKLPDENQVLLRIPRQNNMYSFNLENIVPSRGLTCLIAKATIDESNKWHKRLGHVNFKMTTLVLLVRKESNTSPPVRPN